MMLSQPTPLFMKPVTAIREKPQKRELTQGGRVDWLDLPFPFCICTDTPHKGVGR
jgi:hypothetical protein